jgi:hypothetical protein
MMNVYYFEMIFQKNVYRYIVIHISLCLCYLETVYTTLIVPVATCKNEKVINKDEYR